MDRASYHVYMLCLEGEVVYIGQTHDLIRRIREHVAKARTDPSFLFNEVWAKPILSLSQAGAEERRLIAKFKPKSNHRHVGRELDLASLGLPGRVIEEGQAEEDCRRE